MTALERSITVIYATVVYTYCAKVDFTVRKITVSFASAYLDTLECETSVAMCSKASPYNA